MAADLKERKAESKLMRYCQHGRFIYDVDETSCPASCNEGISHQGRVRRMLVCSECEQGYFTRKGFDAHECHDAY